ncbi:Leucine aminopeptidase 1 [Thoreauomyces humboldtii]|nr:Leucine aminopeptidase 1 [Thoreauomyces humboldtii]
MCFVAARTIMLVLSIFSLLVISVFGYPQLPQGLLAERLIATSETHAEWLSEDAVLDLIRKRKNFVDVTKDRSPLGTDGKSLDILWADHSGFPSSAVRQSAVRPLLAAIDKHRLEAFLTTLTEFHTRQYNTQSGKGAAEWIYHQASAAAAFANARGSLTVTVSKFLHPWAQFSVIARIEPSNAWPPLRDVSAVILSAHMDSVNHADPYKGRAPGADDDGSGTATMFEAYRLLTTSHSLAIPTRPIEFHWYAAEEGGKLGSQEVVASYLRSNNPVRAQLQMDMTGYSPPGKPAIVGIATDNTDTRLATYLKHLVGTYCDIPAGDITCGFACSDHWSWHRKGIPAAFAFEAAFEDSNPNVHTPEDDLSHISFDHVSEYVKLALAFAVEMGLEE